MEIPEEADPGSPSESPGPGAGPASVADAVPDHALGETPGAPRIWIALDVVVLGFALFTLAQNLTWALGGSLVAACGLFVAASVVAVIALRGRWASLEAAPLPRAEEATLPAPWVAAVPIVAALGLGVAVALVRLPYPILWAAVSCLAAGGLVFALRQRPESAERPPPPSPVVAPGLRRGGLVLLAAAAVVVAILAQRSDPDDCHYLQRASAVADAPGEPLPHHQTLFGGEDPLPYPTFGMVSYHDLVGVAAWLTRSDPFVVSAWVLLPILSLLVVVSHAFLLRTLAPRPWADLLLVVVVALLLADASTHRTFANFAFIRIWQGKSILLHIATPLLFAFGARFGARGRWADLVRTAAVEIGMVGLTSTGIWIAPIVAFAGMACGVVTARARWMRVLASVPASGYAIGVGLWAVASSVRLLDYRRIVDDDVLTIIEASFGPGLPFAAWIAALALAPWLAPSRGLRVLAGASILVVFVFLANPLISRHVARYVTSGVVYWRLVWLIPSAVVVASVLGAGLSAARDRPWAGELSLALAAALFIALVPRIYVLSESNWVRLGLAASKLKPAHASLARHVIASIPEGGEVVAPPEIAWIIPALRGGRISVAPKTNLIRHTVLRQRGDAAEHERLRWSLDYAAGRAPLRGELLERLLRDHRVLVVITSLNVQDRGELERILEGHEFGGATERDGYLVWLRAPDAERDAERSGGE